MVGQVRSLPLNRFDALTYLLDDILALFRGSVVIKVGILVGEAQDAYVVNCPGLGSLLMVRNRAVHVHVINHDNVRFLKSNAMRSHVAIEGKGDVCQNLSSEQRNLEGMVRMRRQEVNDEGRCQLIL